MYTLLAQGMVNYTCHATGRGPEASQQDSGQRRRLLRSVKSFWDARMTYLPRPWHPAKPRTGMPDILIFSTCIILFQQELSLDSFNRNHRSTFPVLFIDRRSLLGYHNLPCLIFYDIVGYPVRIEPSDLCMRTEHQLLSLIFH